MRGAPLSTGIRVRNGILAIAAHADEMVYLDGGRVCQGEAIDGRQHGEGRMIWRDDRTYEGTWRDGVRHGEGVERLDRDAKYEGEYREGERSGHGRFT